jgi:hypothetical protein
VVDEMPETSPDRLMSRARPIAPAAEIDHAVEHLASQIHGEHGVQLDALEAICRAVVRLARTRRREVPLDDERSGGHGVVVARQWQSARHPRRGLTDS